MNATSVNRSLQDSGYFQPSKGYRIIEGWEQEQSDGDQSRMSVTEDGIEETDIPKWLLKGNPSTTNHHPTFRLLLCPPRTAGHEMKLPMSSQTYREIAKAWGFPPLVLCSFRQPYWMCTLFKPRFRYSPPQPSASSSVSTPEPMASNQDGLESSETLVEQLQEDASLSLAAESKTTNKVKTPFSRGRGLLIRFDSHWERECAIAVTYNPSQRQTCVFLAGLGTEEVNSVHRSLTSHIRESADLLSHPMLVPTLLLSELVQNQTDWLNLVMPDINSIQEILGMGNWKYGDEGSGWDHIPTPAWIRVIRSGLRGIRKASPFAKSDSSSISIVQSNAATETNQTKSDKGQKVEGKSDGESSSTMMVTEREVVENDALEAHRDFVSEEEMPRHVGPTSIIKRLNKIADSIRFQAQIATTLVRTLEEIEGWLGRPSFQGLSLGGDAQELEEGSKAHLTELEIAETITVLLKSLRGCQQRIEYRRGAVDGLINTVYTLIAQKDSNNMRIIAIITLVLLPGTFTATLFSTPFFDFSASNDSGNATGASGGYNAGSSKINLVSDTGNSSQTSLDSDSAQSSFLSPHHWVYWISTLIITTLTLTGYWLFTKRGERDSIIRYPEAGKKLRKIPLYNITDVSLEARRKRSHCGW